MTESSKQPRNTDFDFWAEPPERGSPIERGLTLIRKFELPLATLVLVIGFLAFLVWRSTEPGLSEQAHGNLRVLGELAVVFGVVVLAQGARHATRIRPVRSRTDDSPGLPESNEPAARNAA